MPETLSGQFTGKVKVSQIMRKEMELAGRLPMSGCKMVIRSCDKINGLSVWLLLMAMILTTTDTRDSAHLDLTEHLLWRMLSFSRTLEKDSERPYTDS